VFRKKRSRSGARAPWWWLRPLAVAAITAIMTYATTRSQEITWAVVAAVAAGGLAFRIPQAGGAVLGAQVGGRTETGTLRRRRRLMLERVRMLRVTEFETHTELLGWMNLPLRFRPDAVASTANRKSHAAVRPLQVRPNEAPIDTFDRADQALLILGRPGAGKTMLLLSLTRELLGRASADSDHPLPVLLNLSSWAGRRLTLDEWLLDQLADVYEIPRRFGQAWLDDEQLLPLLDGLDAVPAEYRDECVEAINVFREEHGALPMAVTSRVDEYEALSVELNIANAVEIRPLTRSDVSAHLRQGSGASAGILAVLERDPTLWDLLDSPLWLSVIAQTPSSDALALPAAETVDRRRELLFAAYFEAMLQRHEADRPYSRERILHWLSWLASALRQHNLSEFSLDRLQLDWLPRRARRFVVALSTLLVACVAGLFFWLFFNLQQEPIGLIAALIGGVIAGVFFWLGFRSSDLRVELQLRWSWHAMRKGLVPAVATGLLVGYAVGAVATLRSSQLSPLAVGMQVGLEAFLLVGLASGFTSSSTPQSQTVAARFLHLPHVPLALGALAGSITVLALDQQGLWFGFQVGLLVQLTALMAQALSAGRRRITQSGPPRRMRSAVTVGVFAAAHYGLLAALIFGTGGLLLGASAGLLLGLSGGMAAGVCYGLGQRSAVIRSAEQLRWSWSAFRNGIRPALILAAIGGLLTGVTVALMGGTRAAATVGFGTGIIVAVVGALINGLSVGQLDPASTTPTDGIRRSTRNAALASLVVAFGIILFFSAYGFLLGAYGLSSGVVVYGVVAGLVAALFFGGMDVFQHALIRSMLLFSGATPRHYVRFLDFAAENLILRKLGGSYVFAHPLLLEHFASRALVAREYA
jgi:NACHT domain